MLSYRNYIPCYLPVVEIEGRRAHQPKHCKHNNEGEGNSSNILNDKNHQALSQKYRQISLYFTIDSSQNKLLFLNINQSFCHHSLG